VSFLNEYFPKRINSGWLLTGYTLPRLQAEMATSKPILPICSLGTPAEQLSELGPLVLPPLYHEALGDGLKERLIGRIRQCFPDFYATGGEDGFDVVELPATANECPLNRPIVAFSVDTAVEEHGPHLPLMTDTIQSYGVLVELRKANPDLCLAPPLEYGHLTWGLPFGMSVDITPELTTEYVANYLDALTAWCDARAFYVVDVHGSIVHRNAIQAGMKRSGCRPMAFRWLHEPLTAYAGGRGDQHAGGVETALVEVFEPDMIDHDWWPGRKDEIEAGQMKMEQAIELSTDLDRFREQVVAGSLNGIVGDVANYYRIKGGQMVDEIMPVAQRDLDELRRSI
jgi:creatinine amidohydrolase/Fe(II)-dependent formamide hydrolase-like protein